MKPHIGALLLLPFVSACVGSTPPQPGRATSIPVPPGMAALTTVLGQNAAGLVAQFGQPILDVSEGSSRKLQFGGPICVLDAYLYPPRTGNGAPVVTFAETRQRDGSPIDQASCAAALKAGRSRR